MKKFKARRRNLKGYMKMKKACASLCICLQLFSLMIYSSVTGVKGLCVILGVNGNASSNEENVVTYVGIAKYYDNRKCAVTSSLDDLTTNTTVWESCLSMLTRKKIYHTVGIITNSSDWNYVQYWLNQGYTEAASHSRNHVHPPYEGIEDSKPKVSYEWQINGSKQDIIGNLTLPALWRNRNKKYVYVWIEPFGQYNEKVRNWLGITHYLCDRCITLSSQVYDFASWDPSNELFNRIGYTVEMGNTRWGGDSSVPSLNSKFDKAYNDSKVYHLMSHPWCVDWSIKGYADRHTDYISNRSDVWYVPLGLLYLYHWVDARSITQVTFTDDGKQRYFRISINQTDHEIYGVSYPITYIFNIPQNWTSSYVYSRYRDEDPWTLMANKSSEDYFNGINTSRFDFSKHEAYVSVAFTYLSDNIYLQIRPSPLNLGPTPAEPFMETLLGKASISGGIIAAIVVTLIVFKRRFKIKKKIPITRIIRGKI